MFLFVLRVLGSSETRWFYFPFRSASLAIYTPMIVLKTPERVDQKTGKQNETLHWNNLGESLMKVKRKQSCFKEICQHDASDPSDCARKGGKETDRLESEHTFYIRSLQMPRHDRYIIFFC